MSPGWAEDWCCQWLRASPLRNNFQATGAAVFWECPLQNIVHLNDEEIHLQQYVLSSSWVIIIWLISLKKKAKSWTVNLTLSRCEVEDGKQLALDLGSELNQLTTSIQILVTGNHLQYEGKYEFISETRWQRDYCKHTVRSFLHSKP